MKIKNPPVQICLFVCSIWKYIADIFYKCQLFTVNQLLINYISNEQLLCLVSVWHVKDC